VIMSDDAGMLTLEGAARYLGVSKTSLRRWTKDGQLQCHRIGARAERRFDKKMLDEFLLRRTAGPALDGIGTPLVDAMWQAAQNGRHKHVCLYFRNPLEQWEAFRQYFLDHYRAGLPTTYLHHASSRERLMEQVRNEGIDPQDSINRGLLRIVSARDSYLRQGVFSADFMISFMRLVMVRLAADGFRKHLLTGEMDWFFTATPGVEEIHAYERRLNKLLDEYPDVTIVCQYDITKFDGEGVLQACGSHPIVHLDDHLRQGFFTPAQNSLRVD
jgi:excisionase family DNA binding protein